MPVGKHLSDNNTDGTSLGQGVSDKISLYGVTPIVQRSGVSQNTTLLTTASSTAIDTLTKAAIIEIMDTLRVIGVWKGSA